MTLPPMAFEPGVEHRHYLTPPPGAAWAELTLRAGAHDTPKLFMVHATQLLPHLRPIQVRPVFFNNAVPLHFSYVPTVTMYRRISSCWVYLSGPA